MNLNTISLPWLARPTNYHTTESREGSPLPIQGTNKINTNYLTLRSVSSLNNPQNSEMRFCEKYEVVMLKIIIIIIGYILNNIIVN
jgi:hypothetical protein